MIFLFSYICASLQNYISYFYRSIICSKLDVFVFTTLGGFSTESEMNHLTVEWSICCARLIVQQFFVSNDRFEYYPKNLCNGWLPSRIFINAYQENIVDETILWSFEIWVKWNVWICLTYDFETGRISFALAVVSNAYIWAQKLLFTGQSVILWT